MKKLWLVWTLAVSLCLFSCSKDKDYGGLEGTIWEAIDQYGANPVYRDEYRMTFGAGELTLLLSEYVNNALDDQTLTTGTFSVDGDRITVESNELTGVLIRSGNTMTWTDPEDPTETLVFNQKK